MFILGTPFFATADESGGLDFILHTAQPEENLPTDIVWKIRELWQVPIP